MDNRATTPHFLAIVQARCFSFFGHIARMPDETHTIQYDREFGMNSKAEYSALSSTHSQKNIK